MQQSAFGEQVDDEQQWWDGVDAGHQHRQHSKLINGATTQHLHACPKTVSDFDA